MHIWSDIGIVISARPLSEKYKIVNIFTKDHGMIAGMYSALKSSKLSVFSSVIVDFSSKDPSSLGFWKIRDENQNWIYIIHDQDAMIFCQGICMILKKVMPQNVSYKSIYELLNYFVNNITNKTKIELLNMYAYFEFMLLNKLGFGLDLKTCSVCGKVEKVDYIFPETCLGISKNCIDDNVVAKTYKVPNIWKIWTLGIFEKTDFLDDLKNSINITGNFISKNLENIENYFRNTIANF